MRMVAALPAGAEVLSSVAALSLLPDAVVRVPYDTLQPMEVNQAPQAPLHTTLPMDVASMKVREGINIRIPKLRRQDSSKKEASRYHKAKQSDAMNKMNMSVSDLQVQRSDDTQLGGRRMQSDEEARLFAMRDLSDWDDLFNCA